VAGCYFLHGIEDLDSIEGRKFIGLLSDYQILKDIFRNFSTLTILNCSSSRSTWWSSKMEVMPKLVPFSLGSWNFFHDRS
jgi:hypothetical protein